MRIMKPSLIPDTVWGWTPHTVSESRSWLSRRPLLHPCRGKAMWRVTASRLINEKPVPFYRRDA